jgi:hypothetical protein
VITPQVDIGNVELLRQEGKQLILGKKTVLHQHASEFAAAFLLVRQRGVELLLRNNLVRNQQVADANLFGFHLGYRCHRDSPSAAPCPGNEIGGLIH